ncbi:MAG: hypothetical protein LBL33_00065 [Tannerella sp.]|nr:hypothetical protein [Tannerella sp.]
MAKKYRSKRMKLAIAGYDKFIRPCTTPARIRTRDFPCVCSAKIRGAFQIVTSSLFTVL